MKILAISGSLREASTHTTVLKSLLLLAPPAHQIHLFDGLAHLPHFNPDLDFESPHPAVGHLREELNTSGAVLFSTPEYAHGLPGSLKNALDWLVRSGERYTKPVALINSSPRATFAQSALQEILTTMGAHLIVAASVTVAIPSRSALTPEAIAANPVYAAPLRAALDALPDTI